MPHLEFLHAPAPRARQGSTIDNRISILRKEIGLWFLATSQLERKTGKTAGVGISVRSFSVKRLS